MGTLKREYDVVIVGLGPVGAVMANLLGQASINTLVVEKSAEIYPLPRAIGLDHDVMRALQKLQLSDAIAPYITPYATTLYRGVHGQLISHFESLPPPYPQGWFPSYVFTQPPFEGALRDGLERYRCVDVALEHSVEAITEAQDYVEQKVMAADGSILNIRTKYLLGCDGGSSFVRKAAKIKFESLGFDEDWFVVDVLVNKDCLQKVPDTIVQFCNPKRPCSYIIGPDNHRRWEFKLLPGESPDQMNTDEKIWSLLAEWITPADGQLWRAAPYVFHALIASQWRKDRIFLLGDAAHLTPPFMAQGMCQGIRDAINLSWKLDHVLKDKADSTLLDTYEEERSPHVRETTLVAIRLGKIISELDPTQATHRDNEILRDAGDPPKVQFRQNLIPRLKSGLLNCSSQNDVVGRPFPQPYLSSNGQPQLLDDVTGTQFRLFLAQEDLLTPHELESLPKSLSVIRLLEKSPSNYPQSTSTKANITNLFERDSLLTEWAKANHCVAALIRPDHYVFGVAQTKSDIFPLLDTLYQYIPMR